MFKVFVANVLTASWQTIIKVHNTTHPIELVTKRFLLLQDPRQADIMKYFEESFIEDTADDWQQAESEGIAASITIDMSNVIQANYRLVAICFLQPNY